MGCKVLKSIRLARRRPLGWDQPDHITLTDPDQTPPYILCQKKRRVIIGMRWCWTARRTQCDLLPQGEGGHNAKLPSVNIYLMPELVDTALRCTPLVQIRHMSRILY